MVADGKMIDVVKPNRVTPGDPVNVDATIENTGDITGTFKLQMVFDGTPVVSTPSFDLEPGATQQQTLSHNAPLVGASVDVELDLYNVIDIADFDALKTYLESGCIGEHWWEFTEDERLQIATLAIANTEPNNAFTFLRRGKANCEGGEGSWLHADCGANAVVRYWKFGEDTPDGYDAYWSYDGHTEHCYAPEKPYNLPCYMVTAASEHFGHQLAGLQIGEDPTSWDSWIVFQYNQYDIKPGDYQMPYGCHVDMSKIGEAPVAEFDI